MLPAHRTVSELVLECGHAVPINDSVKEMRERRGMDVLPESVHKYPEALAEVQTILTRCGFDKLAAGSAVPYAHHPRQPPPSAGNESS